MLRTSMAPYGLIHRTLGQTCRALERTKVRPYAQICNCAALIVLAGGEALIATARCITRLNPPPLPPFKGLRLQSHRRVFRYNLHPEPGASVR
jgi:hypothetical protein